jgi:hypothetical protein
MGKFLNVTDIAIIALSAYVVIWAINWGLRGASVPNLQA